MPCPDLSLTYEEQSCLNLLSQRNKIERYKLISYKDKERSLSHHPKDYMHTVLIVLSEGPASIR